MNIGKTTAQVFSIVLSPLLMPFYSILLLNVYTSFFYFYSDIMWKILGIVLLFSFVLPFLFIIVLKSFGIVKDLDLTDKNERFMPYAVTCFAYVSMTYYFYGSGFQIWFLALLASPILIVIIATSVNYFWKISAHMLGIGGLIGGIMSVCYNVNRQNPFLLLMTLFILAGCLGVSRIYLRKHTPAQVYVGFTVGLIASFLVVWASVHFSIHI